MSTLRRRIISRIVVAESDARRREKRSRPVLNVRSTPTDDPRSV